MANREPRANIEALFVSGRLPTVILAVLLTALLTGCSHHQHHARDLPAVPPQTIQLEVTGPNEGWPPSPREMTDVRLVAWQEIPSSLNDQLAVQIRQAALESEQVRGRLGERFAYLGIDELDLGKDPRTDVSESVATRLTFFNYASNSTVGVVMRDLEVVSVDERVSYQPAEGPDEIATAIAMAREDPRLAGKVEGLKGDAILTFVDKYDDGYGNRVLYVTFSLEEEDLPRYFANVDLTAQRVLAVGNLHLDRR